MKRITRRGAAVMAARSRQARTVRRLRTYRFLADHDGRMYCDMPDERIINQIEKYGMIRIAV